MFLSPVSGGRGESSQDCRGYGVRDTKARGPGAAQEGTGRQTSTYAGKFQNTASSPGASRPLPRYLQHGTESLF